MKPLIFVLIAAGTVFGQMPGAAANVRNQQTYDELRASLGLTDEQLTKLKEMQQEKMTATQAFYGKMADKQKELSAALDASPSDPAKVGQLMLELQQLRKQPPPSGADVHERALALLTADQKEKLAKLEEAQKLRPASDQAVQLALLSPPSLPPSHNMPVRTMNPTPASPTSSKSTASAPKK